MRKEDKVAFQSLVLSGIWLLIRIAIMGGTGWYHSAMIWRANAIGHLDIHGNQSKGAPAYRRETTFPELKV